MRLSTVFELLLIFLFIAFAASRHIDKRHEKKGSLKQTGPNRYCTCTSLMCNCCRDFSLPVVSLKGPGCATIAYLNGDAMRLTMSFGDRILRNITLTGRRPKPVCMQLPGGVSKFCGRVYGIERDGEEQFKACLALELRALDDVEASLRVSCFKFGPSGVKVEPSRPVPNLAEEEDEDDDYELDDDEDEDDDDFDLSEDDEEEDDSAENDVDSGDYTGFSVLSDEFLEGFFGDTTSSENKKKKKPIQKVTKPVTRPPVVIKRPVFTSTEAPIVEKVSTQAPSTTVATPPKEVTTRKSEEVTTRKSEEVTTRKSEEVTTRKNEEVATQAPAVLNDEEAVTSTTISVKVIETVSLATEAPGIEDKLVATTEESEPEEGTDKTETVTEAEEETEEEEEDKGGEEETQEDPTERPSDDSKETEEDDDDDDDDDEDDDKDSSEEKSTEKLEEKESFFGGILEDESDERDRALDLFPGLAQLIRPRPRVDAEAFPPVRSARTHRRMRLPPLQP